MARMLDVLWNNKSSRSEPVADTEKRYPSGVGSVGRKWGSFEEGRGDDGEGGWGAVG